MGYNWSQGGQGAVGGALAGSSIMPGIGTAIGAGIGLLSGFGGGESDIDKKIRWRAQNMYDDLGARPYEQVGQAGQAGYSGFRTNQSDLINRLEALSKGQGPSLAAQQFRQATDQNIKAQQAMAASGRGGNLSAFNAAGNMANLGAQAAQGSALARTNEQMAALSQLGQNINAGRGSDEGVNMFNTGQSNQFQLANLDARLKQMGMTDDARIRLLNQMSGQRAQQAAAAGPGLGSQILAGGAGMYSQYASQNAMNQGGPMSQNGNWNRWTMGVGPQPGDPGWGSSPMGYGSGPWHG